MLLIRSVQVELNNMGAVIKALPHLARPSDRTAKEVLSFVCIMLFNANEDIQVRSTHAAAAAAAAAVYWRRT